MNFVKLFLLSAILAGCVRNVGTETMETYTKEELAARYDELRAAYYVMSKKVIRPAEGYLKYPYLIPAGFYSQMWDWDGFFMGTYFCSKDKPEYLQFWALNLIDGIDEKGYVSGCATTQGPRPIFGDFSMKPFLVQGVLFASEGLGEYTWAEPYYESLKKTIEYRKATQRDTLTGLYFWQNAMQSGADNNVAMNYFIEDPRSFLSCDASTMQVRELEAMSVLAEKLGHPEDSEAYAREAEELRSLINEILWCEEDQIYYNVDRETGEFYKRVSYSCFWPLMDKIAPEDKGSEMIDRYLLSTDHMRSEYGLRTLSKQDPDYNNKNIIVPFSNWQGPVWPIANYIYAIGLKHYGYDREVEWLAMKVTDLLMEDYRKFNTMHENYNAETGEPLAPSDDYKDKDGNIIGFVSWNLCMEPLMKGIVEGDWDLLEVR